MRWWKNKTIKNEENQEEWHCESGFLLDWGFLKIDLSWHKNYYNNKSPEDINETGEEDSVSSPEK